MLMKTATGYIKTPYNMGDCYLLEHYLSIYDAENDRYIPYGYIVHDNTLYIPNINIERFMKALDETEVIPIKPNEWKPMSRHYMSRVPPKDALQENVISFITGEGMYKKNTNEHQIGIVVPPGKGKALPMDCSLPTPTGVTSMKDVKVGTVLFSKDGKPTTVTDVFDQGVQDVYEVVFEDGRSCECSDEHLWEVFYMDKIGLINAVLPLKEIRKRMDEVDCKYFIPMAEPVQYDTESRGKLLPFDVAGAMIANEIVDSHFSIWTTPEIANKIGDLTHTKPYLDTDSGRFCFFNRWNRKVGTLWMMRKLGLYLRYDINKRLFPVGYLRGSEDELAELIVGMMSTKNCRIHDYPWIMPMYVGRSKTLAKVVLYILRGKGYCPVLDQSGDMYRCGLSLMTLRSSLEIKKIRYVGRKECRCIKVDHPSHTFLAADFVVTHNTFTSIYSITNLNRKALIVTHMTKIEDQWVKSMLDMFDYQGDRILRLDIKLMARAMDGEDLGADVYFVNHQILNRWLGLYPPTKLNDVFKVLGIGIKIIDEYHLHWRNSIILDMFTNIDKTIYLTATFGRSNKDEDQLFTRVTENIVTYGSSDRSVEDRHTEYHPVLYNSHCPFRTVRSMASGHGMGIRKWIYADWQHINNPRDDANQIIIDLIKKCLVSEGRILVTVASIKTCDIVADRIRKAYPDEDVGVINSSYSAKENDHVKAHSKIIVSTISSAGTGVDILKLRYVINSEPFSSKIMAEQFLGRLRPYYDDSGEQRTTYLFDLVDTGIMYANIYYKARSKRIAQLAKSVTPIQL